MKNENSKDSIALVIVTIVFLVVIGFVVFSFIQSNQELNINSVNQDVSKNSSNVAPNISSTQSTPSKVDTDGLNIDSNEIPAKQETKTEIATFTSTIYDKDSNRVHNIGLAISKLNNVIIKKGEEFSFNNTVGAMGEAQGYKQAIGFDSNGNKIKVFGGGMCQISSTIYNTALIAVLKITERHPHSRRVYYVPKDKDATVFYGSYDLKFINTTDGDIQINATNDDKSVTIKLIKIT